jgi:hypothetical protein
MCQYDREKALYKFVQDLVPLLLKNNNVNDDIVVLGVEV